MEKDVMKTGTTTIGLVCKDGLVLAADKRATAGFFIAAKKIEKIIKITDDIAVTVAGTVSDIQLLAKLIKAELKLKEIRTGKINTVKEAANLLAGIVYSNIRKFSWIPGISHFIIGGKDMSGFHVYDLSPDGSITDVDDFVSSGSGSPMVYGVLESQYKKDITVKDGVKLAVKGINAAMQRDAASGEGIDVVTITEKGFEKVLSKEIKIDLEA
jgi:proteasome beta subunit